MPILNEVTDHAFFCEGPSMTEPEHAERCSIDYQLKRIAKGLPPNWGNPQPLQYGHEVMDNSITDHNIAMRKTIESLEKEDLSDISPETWDSLSPAVQNLMLPKVMAQKNAKTKIKNQNAQKPASTASNPADPTLPTDPSTKTPPEGGQVS